ncbi:hypothetical protein IM697_01980 [Streptomyces ferrugineus]|uniref:Uncharacterized protein n=1 Tax=Streptomyces ferrugineus TaxID=1413221 RepID=A0A7M2SNJ8_9ACTN|nr:hypothetical protein [Streptomyces ferrugineus]QOV37255.1 hypothetical protein IM697_01980 [Streptomyces ferrugineus]
MLDTVPPASRARARADRCARFGGLAAGALLSLYMIDAPGELGSGVLAAIPGFGLCAMAGVLLGEHITARPRGTVRTAGLAPRRIRDYVPPRLTALLLIEASLLIALLVTATAIGSPDDMGRAGRALTMTCSGVTESSGPWPGFFYARPTFISLAIGTGACGYALRHITRRPGDEQERRKRAEAITAAWGLLVSAPLAGTAWFAAGSLRGLDCDGTLGSVAAWILLPVCLVSLGTAIWCLFTVLAPKAAQR